MIKKAQVSFPTTPIQASEPGVQQTSKPTSSNPTSNGATLTAQDNQFEVCAGNDYPTPPTTEEYKLGVQPQSLLSLKLTGADEPQDGADLNMRNFQRYLDSSFTYEDAELLAHHWGMDVPDAKLAIGEHIADDNQAFVTMEIERGWVPYQNSISAKGAEHNDLARIQNPKSEANREEANWERYADSPFGYDHAALLAQHWGTDVYDAKLTIGEKIGYGQQDSIAMDLQHASAGARVGRGGTGRRPVRREQPRLERTSRRASLDASHALISLKGAHGIQVELPFAPDAKGAPGDRASNIQTFYEAGFSYNDAQILARKWHMPPSDAKALLGQQLAKGQTILPHELFRD